MAFVDNRTNKEWAQEYKDTADMITETLAAVRLERKTAPPSKLDECDFREKTLYRMYLDVMETYHDLVKRKDA